MGLPVHELPDHELRVHELRDHELPDHELRVHELRVHGSTGPWDHGTTGLNSLEIRGWARNAQF